MKHCFILNPAAGKTDRTAELSAKITALCETRGLDYSIAVSCSPGQCETLAREAAEGREACRIYACGGDGTLNEVVTGIIGFPNVQITVHANGSGNDYIKYYDSFEAFSDIARLVEGVPHPVDVMKVNDRYSINVCNFGFDAMVCKIGNDVRRKPIIGGKHSYTTGIIRSIFTSRSNYVRMTVDGEPFYDGHMLLCTLGNGRYNGGNYMCAPLSKNDDGLIEINLFKRMSLFKFASLINEYSQGTHINRPDVQQLMQYRQGTLVEMTSPDPFWLVIDGEMLHSNHYRVQNIKHAITFVSPR